MPFHDSAYIRLKQAALEHSTNRPPADTFFAGHAKVWERLYENRTYLQRRELVLEFVKAELDRIDRRPETINVLDFGCGSGVLLADLVALGVSAVGVDSSNAMIEQARSRLAQVGGRVELEWLQDNSGKGAYQQLSYDVVLCTSVLEFVSDIEAMVSNLCLLVRSGGMLLVTVPNRRSYLRMIEKFVHRHPHVLRGFRQFNHLTETDSYLSYQQHQLAHGELSTLVERQGLRHEQHRFHVAPSFVGKLESSEIFGMMLMATFRK